jgi:hypothetical protein
MTCKGCGKIWSSLLGISVLFRQPLGGSEKKPKSSVKAVDLRLRSEIRTSRILSRNADFSTLTYGDMYGRRICKLFEGEAYSIEDAFSTCILSDFDIYFLKIKNTEKLNALEVTLGSHNRPIRYS